MPYIDREGVRIFFRDAGAGVPILLSHGFGSSSAMWRGQVERFEREYRLITWDMRGHGESDSPDDQSRYSEAATVGDMVAILDACGVSRAVIGGLSLGGYMSLAFNLVHSEKVLALMLFDTGPGYRNDQARADWNETAKERARRLDSEGLAALSQSPEVRAARHRSATGIAAVARGMLTQVDARVISSLDRIAVPALVVVGERDAPYLAASAYMARKIPGARQVVIPAAGHGANLDNPAAFNAAMGEFLAANAGAQGSSSV